jgi:hypothetical protein
VDSGVRTSGFLGDQATFSNVAGCASLPCLPRYFRGLSRYFQGLRQPPPPLSLEEMRRFDVAEKLVPPNAGKPTCWRGFPARFFSRRQKRNDLLGQIDQSMAHVRNELCLYLRDKFLHAQNDAFHGDEGIQRTADQ